MKLRLDARGKTFLLTFVVLVWLSATFLTPFCGLMYQCGCTFLWSGGVQQCNIHQEGVPHCPWCKAGRNPILGLVPVLVIIGGQGLSLFLFLSIRKSTARYLELFAVGVLSFWLFAVVLGYIFKLIFGYPYFFVS